MRLTELTKRKLYRTTVRAVALACDPAVQREDVRGGVRLVVGDSDPGR
jgi:hypothetical protein